MQTNLYLQSLRQDLLEIKAENLPKLDEREASILKKAAELASAGGKKSAGGGGVDSIFSHLIFPRDDKDKSKEKTGLKKSFPKKVMNLEADFFPGSSGADAEFSKKFKEEIEQVLKLSGEKTQAETLLYVFQKYGTVLPSGIAPDISLYDFSKSKAAFAQCLAVFPNLDDLPANPFLLVGGDMSGIQDFIYDIVSTNASKNLKGRSYYLHLLGDTILTCLLEKLDLPLANVVYASGGSFYVLAPNTPENEERLADFEKLVNDNLFAAHSTLLSFVLDRVKFSEKIILDRKIDEVWKNLSDGFNRKKRAKFNQQLENNFKDLFKPSEMGGDLRRDVVTGAEILDSEMDVTYKLEDSFPEKVSQLEWGNREVDFIRTETTEQIFMGLFLKKTMFRMNGSESFTLDFEKSFDEKRLFEPCNFGIRQYILDEKDVKFSVKSAAPRQTLKINKFDFLENENDGIKGFEFYGGNQFPDIKLENIKRKVAKTFSEMAGMEDDDRQNKYEDEFQEAKFKRLGILRMDVDNLGKIFEEAYQGIGTLAHYSALSRQLDWFFKGYLNTIWDDEVNGKTNGYLWKEHTQIIYSGGDDLFIVGKWDCLIDFAEKIRTDFKKWTCDHEGMGISGGIVLVTPKFPVIKAAQICEKAEKNAKKHKVSPCIKKNAMSLFDYPLNWEHEWSAVKNLKNQFVEMVRKGREGIPKSLLMMLGAYHELKKEQVKSKESPTWRWQIAYNLTRQKQRVRSNEAFKFIEDLATHILVSGELGKPRMTKYEYFDLVAVAVRWAEYELRTGENDNN